MDSKKSKILILCGVGLVFVLFLVKCYRSYCEGVGQSWDMLQELIAERESYFGDSQWSLKGRIASAKPDMSIGLPSMVLLEIDVDSFDVRKSNLKSDSPYFGLYNREDRKAYIVTMLAKQTGPIVKTYKVSDDHATIEADTEARIIRTSDGYKWPLQLLTTPPTLDSLYNTSPEKISKF